MYLDITLEHKFYKLQNNIKDNLHWPSISFEFKNIYNHGIKMEKNTI